MIAIGREEGAESRNRDTCTIGRDTMPFAIALQDVGIVTTCPVVINRFVCAHECVCPKVNVGIADFGEVGFRFGGEGECLGLHNNIIRCEGLDVFCVEQTEMYGGGCVLPAIIRDMLPMLIMAEMLIYTETLRFIL